MKPIHLFTLCTLASAVAVSSVQAQGGSTFASKPLGYTTVDCLSGSDTIISVPFHKKSTFVGKLDVNPAVDPGNDAVLTVNGASPNWNANQFVNSHYVRMTSGTREGHWYHVMANGANSLTLDLNGDDFAGVVAADTFKLVEHWTLATLFPPGNATIHGSNGTIIPFRRTEVFFPNLVVEDINLAADGIYFQDTSVAGAGDWKKAETGFPISNDVLITPDRFVTIRHKTISADTKFIPLGSVECNDLVTPVFSRSGGKRDNAIAVARPIPVALKDYGLSAPAFTPSSGTIIPFRRDELLVFDNSIAGINKAAAHIYFFDSQANGGTGAWRDALPAPTINRIADNDLIDPATGVVHRRSNIPANGVTEFWRNSATYPTP